VKYPIAPNGIFWSLQGEGHLRGFQMCFVRLAGCGVGCPQCDTNYSVFERLTVREILDRILDVVPAGFRDQWVWITGGEPCDHDIKPLLRGLKASGYSTAVATSGKHRVIFPVDWLSVSYHGGYPLAQQYGNEIKLVVGLNGLVPAEYQLEYPDSQTDFFYRYVQPMWSNGAEDPKSLQACLEFLSQNPNWAMSRQDHKLWKVD
tara:strand:+ start:317 stop:928 length:612 start_codon:yes stop_codon:yes gene_type:complete